MEQMGYFVLPKATGGSSRQSASCCHKCAGSSLLTTEEEAVAKAEQTGYPVLLKATGGGGGIGIYACPDTEAVRQNFAAAGRRAAHHSCTSSCSLACA